MATSTTDDLSTISPDAIDLEHERMLDEHFAVGRRGMRSPGATAGLVAVAAGVGVLPAWSPARQLLGIGLDVSVPLAAISALAIIHAAIAFHRVGGTGRWYRIAEHVESICSVSCGVLLIYFSGSAPSIFWIYLLLFIADAWNNPRDAKLQATLYGIGTAMLSIGFALRGALADAAIAASLGLFGAVCIFTFSSSATHRLRGEAERRVLRAQLEGLLVERERSRIARDLHDGVAADLSTLVWRAAELKEAVAGVGNGEASALVDELMSDARSSLDELGDVVFALRVSGDAWEDFVARLRQRITRLCAGSLRYELVIDDALDSQAPEVPVDVRIHMLRIVQEAVRNAIRHARAKSIRIEIERGAEVVVRVSDDGDGISDEAIESSRGGVSNIATRARILGGAASWSRDSGTQLVVTLPANRPTGT